MKFSTIQPGQNINPCCDRLKSMKTVILAGGLGTRISEESHLRPKPMIEVGGKPILWHIMKMFGNYDFNEFIICCGYRGYVIKEYFANYFLHMSDITLDMSSNSMTIHQKHAEPWKVTLIDTGEETGTGGRIKRISDYIDGTFFLTYGDGLSDIDLAKLKKYHEEKGTLATVTSIQPAGRFGSLEIDNTLVTTFQEKPIGDKQWVSGGFFVCEPEVLQRINGDSVVWEEGPLRSLVVDQELSAYKHQGFWHAMDTLRDKVYLESLWESGHAPWKKWK
jgi:glucose-1-phosphate cytidylyltransferase